jgi:hypothetical protein
MLLSIWGGVGGEGGGGGDASLHIYYIQQQSYLNLSCLVLLFCTVIRFVSISAKFGICNVVSLNGTLVEVKIRTWELGHLNVHILASTSVPL